MSECLLCGRPEKGVCHGCDEPHCGYHLKKYYVLFIGKFLTQMLCPICSLADEGASIENGFFLASRFDEDLLKEAFEEAQNYQENED